MKFRDVVTEVLFCRVAEKLKLRVVCPQDPAMRAYPVHADGGSFQKGCQLSGLSPHLRFALPERRLVLADHQRGAPKERGQKKNLDQRSERGSECGVHD